MDKPTMVRKGGGMLYCPAFDITLSGEGGGEYTMPDYYPEIRRVVSVCAEALPDSKFLSGNLLEFGGTLAFTLLYIGDDGSLVSLPYACEYQLSSALPAEVSGTAGVSVDTAAESAQCRVLAPRSVSLRAKLRSRIFADSEKPYSCRAADTEGAPCTAGDEKSIERLSESVMTLRRGRSSATGSISGEMRDGRGAKPVSCAAGVVVTDISAKNDSITVRGEIALRCITYGADGLYSPARGRLPFEQTLTAEGVSEGDSVCAWGRAASVSVSAGEDGGAIRAEVEYDLDAEWYHGGKAAVVSDAYSTEYELECKRENLDVLRPLCCVCSSLTQSAEGSVSKPSPDAYLIDAAASPVFEKAESREGKLIFTGSCPVKVYIASAGEVLCEEIKLALKFEARSETEGEVQPSQLVWQANAALSDITARLDGTKISVTAEMNIAARAAAKQPLSPVCETVIDRRTRRAGTGMVMKICYPRAGERVWETAKRCRAAGGELEKINKVSRSDISDGTALIVTVK